MVYKAVSKAIQDSGLKQKYIAEQINVTDPVMSAMVTGKRKISAEEYFAICKVLGRNPDEVFKSIENKN
jgi:plasmid maintenance system antidote protein VapI